MAVHLTKIYTRTGDDGTTGLSNFDRVPKDDSRLVAYADCDEANCAIGQVLALGNPGSEMKNTLMRVQNELFDAGADLATPIEENPKYPPLRIDQSYIDRLEHDCDHYNTNLEPLNSFILPGGTPAAALLHTARTIVRRAERAKYLNRLSDLMFILARVANDGDDVPWVPGGERNDAPRAKPTNKG